MHAHCFDEQLKMNIIPQVQLHEIKIKVLLLFRVCVVKSKKCMSATFGSSNTFLD